MSVETESLIRITSEWALLVQSLAIALALVRLVRGPDAADRIVALDLISILVVTFLATYSIASGETSFLDVAIAYALIAFLGTVALARLLRRKGKGAQTTARRGERQ
jgi:multicomponent Na+:H+ antiporter subunit F